MNALFIQEIAQCFKKRRRISHPERIVEQSLPADKGAFNPPQQNQHYDDEGGGKYGDPKHALADCDPYGSDHKNGRRRSQSGYGAARLKNDTCPQKADAGNNLRNEPGRIRVGLSATDVPRNYHEQRGAQADEHVGAQSGRFSTQLSLETDGPTTKNSHQELANDQDHGPLLGQSLNLNHSLSAAANLELNELALARLNATQWKHLESASPSAFDTAQGLRSRTREWREY